MRKDKSQKLADEYVKAERKLLAYLHTLKNSEKMCDCQEPEPIETVYSEGCYLMVVQYCIKCGGAITP